MADEQLDAWVREHGQPVRFRTGVAFDEDGWQAICQWYFSDGSVARQYLMPASSEAEAETQRAAWSQAIQAAFRQAGVEISEFPPEARN